MTIIKTKTKGYKIRDDKGRIHARNIPDLKLAEKFLKEIKIARGGL